MKNKLSLQLKYAILSSILFTSLFVSQISATETIHDWIQSYPWIGLVAEEVPYGPITIEDVNLGGDGRLVFAKPGEKIEGRLKYKINADQLSSWHLHHIIVGLKNQEAQSCITHTLGLGDKNGKANFTIDAPTEKGVYELRFDYQDALLCEDAKKAWHDDQPSSRATIGIVIVK